MITRMPHQQLIHLSHLQPDTVFLRQIEKRRFVDYTFKEVVEQALKLVSALRELGFQPKDKIGIISKNCAHWFIADLAIILGDYISVPIFPTARADTIKHVISHSDMKGLFVGKLDDTQVLNSALEGLDALTCIAFPSPTLSCGFQWQSLMDKYVPAVIDVDKNPDDVMSIVYTSGTSGLPKGAVLSFGAYAWTVDHLIQTIGIKEGDRLFSYLPLAHITERVYIMGTAFHAGICTAFPESLDTFIDDVKMHKPTLFISVPRLWTLFQQRIQQKLPEKRLDFLLKIPFVSSLIKIKIAKNLGLDKARVLGCGSAPVPSALLSWYEKLDLPICEAWGMTENFGFGTLNFPFNSEKIGTVGKANKGVTLSIADDKEVLIKTAGCFSGYYKLNEQPYSNMLDTWFNTGDLGELDEDGCLSITGRKHDTFKTAKGKFVCPVPIEKRIFELSNIEMLCLIGSGLQGPVLLALPHHYEKFDRKRYEKRIIRVISLINQEVESHEKIRGVLLINTPWTIDNNCLTPTLKIKRHFIEQKYLMMCEDWPEGQLCIWE